MSRGKKRSAPAPAASLEKVQSPYRDHMSQWESKSEAGARDRELAARQENVDLAKHPKFAKFKSHGGKSE